MKLYIVYFRTMEDSPMVSIVCATTSKAVADEQFAKAKAEAKELTQDYGGDSGNWYEARKRVFSVPGIKTGDTIHLLVRTEWYEVVKTDIFPFVRKEDAESLVAKMKADYLEEFPDIAPFYDDETIEEARVLDDEDEQVTIYFDIVDAKVQ